MAFGSPDKPKVLAAPQRQETLKSAAVMRRDMEALLKKQRSRQESMKTNQSMLSPLRKYTPTLKERLGA